MASQSLSHLSALPPPAPHPGPAGAHLVCRRPTRRAAVAPGPHRPYPCRGVLSCPVRDALLASGKGLFSYSILEFWKKIFQYLKY